jgi:DNA-binding GntR family transcriptional regulator
MIAIGKGDASIKHSRMREPLTGTRGRQSSDDPMTSSQNSTETPRRRKPRASNAPPRVSAISNGPRTTKNSEIVYRDLKRDIISMALPPGTPIIEKELTERYGISRTPVREATLRLAEEKLVDIAPKSGTFVARIPMSVLREAIVARRALEEVIIRAATERASASQIMELRAIIQRQQEMAEAGREEDFHIADNDFHAGIANAGKYPGIWDIIQQLKVQIERYRRLTLPQAGRMNLVVQEHTAMLDAIEKRDPDLAVRKMDEHLNKLQLDIAVFRDMWPDYFIYDPNIEADLDAS